MDKIKQLIRDLEFNDELYEAKLDLLTNLIKDPGVGRIVKGDDLVAWCQSVELDVECHFEDRTSWWTCRYLRTGEHIGI